MKHAIFLIFHVFYFFSIISGGSEAFAETYRINVTREDSNLYQVSGQDILIKTRYCYEYAYGQDAILSTNGYGGELIFLGSTSGKCDVESVYGKAKINNGTYVVQVSREDDNVYTMFGFDGFIKTDMCLSLALSTKAILEMRGPYGTMHIEGYDCMVKGVYQKIRLK